MVSDIFLLAMYSVSDMVREINADGGNCVACLYAVVLPSVANDGSSARLGKVRLPADVTLNWSCCRVTAMTSWSPGSMRTHSSLIRIAVSVCSVVMTAASNLPSIAAV